jgi:uncharacterized membrane protein
MIQQVVHVAVLDNQQSKNVEHISIRRCVDEIVLIYPYTDSEQTLDLKHRYENAGLCVRSMSIDPNNFDGTLSTILKALDDHRIDNHSIEFNISCRNPSMIIAACVAAMILRAPILAVSEDGYSELIEVRPSELSTLTSQKRLILEYLSFQSKPVTQKRISKEVEISRSGISRHIRDLERAGYVIRWRDGRRKKVSITDLGLTILHHKLLRKRRIWGTLPLQTKEIYS